MKHVMIVGGGTLGPVTPLLAVVRAIRNLRSDVVFSWVGTPNGPERVLVEAAGIPFHVLPVAKLAKHPSLNWFAFPFQWMKARMAAKELIQRLRPDLVAGVGGFTAVPLMFAAHAAKIPCVTHQLDWEPGLANKPVVKFCDSVTSSFVYDKSPFAASVHVDAIPTPVRYQLQDLPTRNEGAEVFKLDPTKPIVLIFGGGTGAQALNEQVQRTLPQWLQFTQVIHLTGLGKGHETRVSDARYVRRALLDKEMLSAYACADLVICRAGIGTLSELAALQKPAIIVPLPQSPQLANAREFADVSAAVVIDQDSPVFDQEVLERAKNLLHDADERLAMARRMVKVMPTDDGTTLAKRIVRLLQRD